MRRNFPEGKYYNVYEAGFCGFSVHEKLESQGIRNIVVNSADVPTTDKEKRRKTDGVDCRKLARSLSNGDLSGIYIPAREKQEDRSLVRLRSLMVKDQTRNKNRIKSVLRCYGIIIPKEKVGSHWSKKYIAFKMYLNIFSQINETPRCLRRRVSLIPAPQRMFWE